MVISLLAYVGVVGHVLSALEVGERDGHGVVVVEDVVDGLGDGHGGGEQVLHELQGPDSIGKKIAWVLA